MATTYEWDDDNLTLGSGHLSPNRLPCFTVCNRCHYKVRVVSILNMYISPCSLSNFPLELILEIVGQAGI
jgi:hypothetical protein